jgi:hypothetical protein
MFSILTLLITSISFLSTEKGNKHSHVRKIIYLSLLMTSIPVTAATFSMQRAIWNADGWFLWVAGSGEPALSVELYIAGTDHLLATTKVNFKERWGILINNPDLIPCSVRAESGDATAESAISSAPADCVDASSLVDPAPTNHPPDISGTPPTSVVEGEFYSFTPTASDPDGDTLIFSISGQPAWANFDTATGTVSGIPALSDLGVYRDIIIQVSDGNHIASLSPFSITVATAMAAGWADLSWEIPTARTDGSELPANEIAGYRIWLGTRSDDLHVVADLNDGSVSSYTVTDLSAGTYYFAVTVYDTDNIESGFSAIVSMTVM